MDSRVGLKPSRRAAYVIGLAVVLAATGATVGGLFVSGEVTTNNTPTPLITSVSITPDAPACLVSPNGDVTVSLDSNTVNAPSQLTFVALTVADIPALPRNFKATGKAFDLTTGSQLLQPIIITVALSAADAALAGGVEHNIVIQRHRDGTWARLPMTVDFTASTATAQVDSDNLRTHDSIPETLIPEGSKIGYRELE